MKIIWSQFAINMLKEIYSFHKHKAGVNIAHKIKTNIFKASKALIKHSKVGQVEPSLKIINDGHRYIIEGNYKIIYREIENYILITDVFDTRQNPQKIKRTL